MAIVEGNGEEPIECIPIVYDEAFNCGLGVVFPDGKGQIWGMVTPRNLITAWRGTEVLRFLDRIEHGTLCAAYYAGQRNPHSSESERIKSVIEKIGQDNYDRIMKMPVPEELIRAILDNQSEEFAPDLYPITDEVRAGTIQWRQEFADSGIKHPDEIDAKARQQEETVAKFEELLASYAKARNLPRQCLGMSHVEGALLTLVEKGAGKVHSDDIIVALSGVVGELAASEFAMFMMPFGNPSPEEMDKITERRKREAIDKAAAWLVSEPETSLWDSFLQLIRWKQKTTGALSLSEAKSLLYKLLDEYFPVQKEQAA